MIETLEITIPVLNEEETLYEQVEKVVMFIEKHHCSGIDVSIAIADNGSTDRTVKIAKELVGKHPNGIRLVSVPEKGVGAALQASWSSSKADLIGYMDLDLATDMKHINEVVDVFHSQSCDILYGSRLSKGSVVKGRSLKREITSRVFNFILQAYLRVDIKDGMCGFKFLRRDCFPSIKQQGANSKGWFFCTELLVVGIWQGKRVIGLPVNWTDDPNSKVNIVKLAIEYLKAMRRLKRCKHIS